MPGACLNNSDYASGSADQALLGPADRMGSGSQFSSSIGWSIESGLPQRVASSGVMNAGQTTATVVAPSHTRKRRTVLTRRVLISQNDSVQGWRPRFNVRAAWLSRHSVERLVGESAITSQCGAPTGQPDHQ